jgi:ADP-ribose pyrophosphatase YjhB (NUDIX family)
VNQPAPVKDSHCSWCGQAYEADQGWPRRCGGCERFTYRNPLPVAVLVLPVGVGVLTIRRGIEPKRGELALPGGFIGLGESWQVAAARELEEETGLQLDAAQVEAIRGLCTISAPDGTLLVFGVGPRLEPSALPEFKPNTETTELVVIDGPQDLAFPLHTQALAEYFASLST